MTTLVTGAAGFIGFHVARALLTRGDAVVGFDVVNDYYDPSLKEARLARLEEGFGEAARGAGTGRGFRFIRADLADVAAIEAAFADHGVTRVVHLAAQAGVRRSIERPQDYVHSNLVGFANILEAARRHQVDHLTYASTSSVYGANTRMPYRESDSADHPLQFYAATKRANELMAHSYSHLFGLPTTGLRFFTVYGPWGRPDMAPMLFARAIVAGEPIDLFNYGHHSRDFTYIDDIVEGVVRASDRPAAPDPDWSGESPDPSRSSAPFRIYNIGANQPAPLLDFVAALETALGRKAERRLLPMQPGDAPHTYADSSALMGATGYRPSTTVDEGVARFIAWFRAYYGV